METQELNLSRGQIVEALTERDGLTCYLCDREITLGLEMNDPLSVTIDHVIPRSKGGSLGLENLKLTHRKCNLEKADREFLEDGTLEPKPYRQSYKDRKLSKQKALDEFCELCYDGRLLLPDESCPECDRGAVAFPWSTKVTPNECSHSGVWWCWCCAAGIISRQPAIVDVLGGDEIVES